MSLKKIGSYTLKQTLGQGSFGKVKLAVNNRNEKVAIKIVDKSTIRDVEDMERVFRESFILISLKHKNIIKLFEVIDTADSILLVMEYAGGGDLLDKVLKAGRLDEIEAHKLFTEILNGVEYCHRAKIIHRDLKLENILLDEDGNAKVADFGLSNSIKFSQKMSTHCGTPVYTCPEQILGHKYIGSSADIWSMGVILFCMVSGFLPFEAPSIPVLFRRIRHRLFVPPPYMSKECRAIIDRMLTLDPERRVTISELRSDPWMLQDSSMLGDKLSKLPKVTASEISDARQVCMNVVDDPPKSSSSASLPPLMNHLILNAHSSDQSTSENAFQEPESPSSSSNVRSPLRGNLSRGTDAGGFPGASKAAGPRVKRADSHFITSSSSSSSSSSSKNRNAAELTSTPSSTRAPTSSGKFRHSISNDISAASGTKQHQHNHSSHVESTSITRHTAPEETKFLLPSINNKELRPHTGSARNGVTEKESAKQREENRLYAHFAATTGSSLLTRDLMDYDDLDMTQYTGNNNNNTNTNNSNGAGGKALPSSLSKISSVSPLASSRKDGVPSYMKPTENHTSHLKARAISAKPSNTSRSRSKSMAVQPRLVVE